MFPLTLPSLFKKNTSQIQTYPNRGASFLPILKGAGVWRSGLLSEFVKGFFVGVLFGVLVDLLVFRIGFLLGG